MVSLSFAWNIRSIGLLQCHFQHWDAVIFSDVPPRILLLCWIVEFLCWNHDFCKFVTFLELHFKIPPDLVTFAGSYVFPCWIHELAMSRTWGALRAGLDFAQARWLDLQDSETAWKVGSVGFVKALSWRFDRCFCQRKIGTNMHQAFGIPWPKKWLNHVKATGKQRRCWWCVADGTSFVVKPARSFS